MNLISEFKIQLQLQRRRVQINSQVKNMEACAQFVENAIFLYYSVSVIRGNNHC